MILAGIRWGKSFHGPLWHFYRVKKNSTQGANLSLVTAPDYKLAKQVCLTDQNCSHMNMVSVYDNVLWYTAMQRNAFVGVSEEELKNWSESVGLRFEKQIPLVADRGYDSDPLRDRLGGQGIELLSPHRKNRTKPFRNDGRKMRRYSRRYVIERTNSWYQSFRRGATRWERYSFMYHGFVRLACIVVAVGKL